MRVKSKKLRASARGRDCQLRLFGVCNHNPETVVLAHVGFDSGMGMKCGDNMAIFACSNCHAEIDGPRRLDYSNDILRALESTQQIWFNEGLMSHE